VSITVGIEVEHGMVPEASRDPRERYDRLLNQEKTAKILHDLMLDEYFPKIAQATTTLCVIKKLDDTTGQYKDFLSVFFDTHGAKSMLEFASIGLLPEGSGILEHRLFLSQGNLQDIREAIREFDNHVTVLSRPQLAAASAAAQSKFQFEIADHARPFLSNGLIMKKTGARK
jgi:hypothetical protein